ncbi:MAG: chitosanase [Acidobacteria bacterium]|nr:chitosanase [Acidobacteriota bacterium]
MFNEIEREKALAIVRIFETGRVKPDYRALAVLNDGAGVSYGMFQFTHRSGALCDVVERYLKAAGAAGRDLLESRMPLLARTTPRAVEKLADDREFHAALRTAAGTAEMRAAQHQVAHVRYIAPALRICDEFGFVTPLALAAVLDGIVHGSFARFARLAKGRSERVRVSDYLRRRDAWLRGSVRLRATAYRTSFFLREAARGNWQLELPLTVNGHRLTAESLEQDRGAASVPPTEALPEPAHNEPQAPAENPPTDAPRPTILAAAGEAFDEVDVVVEGIARRTERARTLWATLAGTLWQTLWAAVAFLAGIPKEVWIAAAVAAAILTAIYVYRQLKSNRNTEAKK